MKKLILLLTMVISSLFARAGTPERMNEFTIGLSPFQPAAERTKQLALLQRFLLTDCPNGSRVRAMDAWGLTTIFDLQLPKLAYDSPAARAPLLVPAFGALQRWFGVLDTNQVPTALKDTAAIKIPEFFDAATARPATGYHTIIILASPFCLVPDEPSFSMIESRYPSDGHLPCTTAASVYGIADKHGRLANTAVLWAYPSESIWSSQYHRERITRWWTLFIAGQGGVFGSFCGDAPQVLLAATQPAHRPIAEFALNRDDSAMVMHVAVQRNVQVEQPQPALPKVRRKPVASVGPLPVPAPQIPLMLAPNKPAPLPDAKPPEPLQAAVDRQASVSEPLKTKPEPKPPRQVARKLVLDVMVTDLTNRPVAGLTQADFAVLEDGVKQEIVSVSHERTPISVVLLIDSSGSISTKLNRIRAAAASIIRQGYPQDEWCVMEFKKDVVVRQDFTTNVTSAESALKGLTAGGDTALLDAVKFAVEYANMKGKHERKGLVLVTDGGEENSRCSRDEVLAMLRSSNAQFHTIGFPDGLTKSHAPGIRGNYAAQSQPADARARNLLTELANASSGGQAFYPKQTADLNQIAESIATELRTPAYRIAYYSSRSEHGAGSPKLRVTLKPSQERGELIARASAGSPASHPDSESGKPFLPQSGHTNPRSP